MKTPKSLTITLQPDGFWHYWLRREGDAPSLGEHLCCEETPDGKTKPRTYGPTPCRVLSVAAGVVGAWLDRHTEPTVGGE